MHTKTPDASLHREDDGFRMAYGRLSGALLDIASQSSDATAVEVALDALDACLPDKALAAEIRKVRERTSSLR